MLDLLLSVSLIACALAWAWFGVESLRRRTLQPTRPETYPGAVSTRTSLLGAGLCAALGVVLIDRGSSDYLEHGVMANEPQGAPAPAPQNDYVYSGATAPEWWAAFPDGVPGEDFDMTDEFPTEGEHADGLNWKPLGS